MRSGAAHRRRQANIGGAEHASRVIARDITVDRCAGKAFPTSATRRWSAAVTVISVPSVQDEFLEYDSLTDDVTWRA
jgi:hypothetical protein